MTVRFGSSRASVLSASPTSITAVVGPAPELQSGSYELRISPSQVSAGHWGTGALGHWPSNEARSAGLGALGVAATPAVAWGCHLLCCRSAGPAARTPPASTACLRAVAPWPPPRLTWPEPPSHPPSPLPPLQAAPEQTFTGLVFNYQEAPRLVTVSPAAAPADVDTLLTVTGSGFTFAATKATILVGNLPCTNPTVVSPTALTCLVRATTQRYTAPTPLSGYVEGIGNMLSSATFTFLHYWSRPATWAPKGVPADGDAVLVPSGMTVVLDTSTAALASLVLEGNLVFDPTVPAIQLTSGSVLVKGGCTRRPAGAGPPLCCAASPTCTCAPAATTAGDAFAAPAALPSKPPWLHHHHPTPHHHTPHHLTPLSPNLNPSQTPSPPHHAAAQAATCRPAPTTRPSLARPPSP